MVKELEIFLIPYESKFRVYRKTVKEHAYQFVKGLFVAERGKRNIERMTEKVKDSDYESLQHTISNSTWDTKGLTQQAAVNAAKVLRHLGLVGLTIDEKAHLKKGKKSAGVARQYAGVIGKVENCQVGVYASLNADKYSTIINHRLYLPKEWTQDKQRCAEAGIREEEIAFKTKPQLACEMVEELIAWGISFDYINGDGLYGHGYELAKCIERLGKKYVLDIHSNETLYLSEPIIGIPEKAPGSKGRDPKRLKPDTAGISAEKYLATLRRKDFKKVRIRKSTKGWIEAYIHVKEVWVWDEACGDEKAMKQTLIIRKPIHKKGRLKFSLSNIGVGEQNVEMFAFMQGQRYWIEKSFRDDSHDLGMSDYQVRTFKGWNNHMALTSLAMLFVMEQRIKHKEAAPLLSYNDVRELIAEKIINNGKNSEMIIENVVKRQGQREKDILRYYQNEFNIPK